MEKSSVGVKSVLVVPGIAGVSVLEQVFDQLLVQRLAVQF
jgi:hypothetical protein